MSGPRPAGPDDGAESAGDPAVLPDHLADVVGGDVELEDDRALPLGPDDADVVGGVDEVPRQVLEQILHRRGQMPFAFMSRLTGSVG